MAPDDALPFARAGGTEGDRYARHRVLAGVGPAGQARLAAASALVVGAGGLGSGALPYLAALGVGRLGLSDGETVEPSNLNRQVLYGPADVGRVKVEAAAERLAAVNPDVRLETFAARVTAETARARVAGWDVVLDCTDNFPARFAVADACWAEGVPLVSAAAVRFEGLLLAVLPEAGSPCYRCLVPEAPPRADEPRALEVGVFGPVPGVLGTLQALEAGKVLLGLGGTLADRLLVVDGLAGTMRTVRRTRDPACPVCGVVSGTGY